ncbi:glycosyltransferase family 4 protein, partial [Patescibacteria group bacterium]|nr:glycosyltransferase family 4 protein [Patescibacteria group bacterium]
MKIGIDCRTILSPEMGERAGVGHYTYFLVKNLIELDKKNEYVLFFDLKYPEAREFKKKNTKLVFFPLTKYKKFLPYGYSHLIISSLINREGLDVYHGTANSVPLSLKVPCVVTIHYLAIYKHPSWFPPNQGFSIKVLVPKSIEKAEKVIAVSESTKKDIKSIFKTSNNKIEIVYEGFEKASRLARGKIEKILKKFDIKGGYIFYVGTIEPRKNLDILVKAFDNVMMENFNKFKDYKLFIAGGRGWKFDKFFEAVKKSKCGRIRYLNYVSHEEKIALMSAAKCFAFPSLWEGFGLPVLEAMNLGTPVLTSNVSSLPEVAGKAAVLVNPKSVKA